MTDGDQRDDFMMRGICANDLRLEMAHWSQCGSVQEGSIENNLSTLRSVSIAFCEHCVQVLLMSSTSQARHFHCTRLACFTRVKGPSTVPRDEVRLVDVLLSTFLRYQLIRLHTFLMCQLIRLHTFFLNLWNGNIHDLIQSSRFSGTYGENQSQQLKRRLCMLLYHAIIETVIIQLPIIDLVVMQLPTIDLVIMQLPTIGLVIMQLPSIGLGSCKRKFVSAMLSRYGERRVFLFARKTIKQLDSPCLSAQCVAYVCTV